MFVAFVDEDGGDDYNDVEAIVVVDVDLIVAVVVAVLYCGVFEVNV